MDKKRDAGNIALIFPAFLTDFIGTEDKILKESGEDLSILIEEASDISGNNLKDFHIESNNFLNNEVQNQIISYIFSCAYANLLKKKNIYPDYIAGYSMGLYATLYFAGSISFSTGIKLICNAFETIKASLPAEDFAMGVTGGLDSKDILEILEIHGKNSYIINSNSAYSFVFSGPAKEVSDIIEAAREEGALQTRIINVSVPYHSPYIKNAVPAFTEYINNCNIQKPEYKIISANNQGEIDSAEKVKKEMINNIYQPFHWYLTIHHLVAEDVETFIECGAGESLTKINKFIEGNFRTYNLKNIHKFFNQIC